MSSAERWPASTAGYGPADGGRKIRVVAEPSSAFTINSVLTPGSSDGSAVRDIVNETHIRIILGPPCRGSRGLRSEMPPATELFSIRTAKLLGGVVMSAVIP